MTQTNRRSMLRMLVLAVLIAAMALSMTACGKTAQTADTAADTKTFTLEVTGASGETVTHEITSSAETVGEALLDEGLIEGENSEYGLYVKTVDGETADYNVDGHYWAFYINGEYASTGVDSTDIEDGAVYAFIVE